MCVVCTSTAPTSCVVGGACCCVREKEVWKKAKQNEIHLHKRKKFVDRYNFNNFFSYQTFAFIKKTYFLWSVEKKLFLCLFYVCFVFDSFHSALQTENSTTRTLRPRMLSAMHTTLCLLLYVAVTLTTTHAIQMTGVKSTHQKHNTCKYANCQQSQPEKLKGNHSQFTEPNGFESDHTRRFLQEAVDLDIPITDLTTEARVLLEMTVEPPGR
jgi:hypothetical protein